MRMYLCEMAQIRLRGEVACKQMVFEVIVVEWRWWIMRL